MTTLDLESLHAALDADPSDQLTRRVLSDAYEDAGDMAMADGLRRMASADLVPFSRGGPWRWIWFEADYRFHGAQIKLCARARLPEGVSLTKQQRSGGQHTEYPTRRAAEEALCRALARK